LQRKLCRYSRCSFQCCCPTKLWASMNASDRSELNETRLFLLNSITDPCPAQLVTPVIARSARRNSRSCDAATKRYACWPHAMTSATPHSPAAPVTQRCIATPLRGGRACGAYLKISSRPLWAKSCPLSSPQSLWCKTLQRWDGCQRSRRGALL